MPEVAGLSPRILDENERLDGPALSILQEARLGDTIQRAHRSPLYRDRLTDALGFGPSEDADRYRVDGWAVLESLPMTTKSDLRACEDIESVLAVPLEKVRRWHTSSGTTGRRTPMGYTANDLAGWGRLIERNLAATGVTTGTRVHNAYGYGLFTGGLGFETGLAPMGATVLPASSAPDVDQHLELMHQHRAQVLLSTPGLGLAIAEAVERQSSLRPPELEAGIFGGDGWSPALRRHIESVLGIRAHDTYGLSEVLGPGVAHACSERDGLHLYTDAFLLELIDPDDGVPLTPGTEGELVLTGLLQEASPRLRYRTGDRVAVEYGRCACGRATPRIRNVARGDDIRIYAGRALAPNDIEAALLEVAGIATTFRIIAPQLNQELLQLEIEALEPARADIGEQVRKTVATLLEVPVSVRVLELGSLPRSPGKRVRLCNKAWFG